MANQSIAMIGVMFIAAAGSAAEVRLRSAAGCGAATVRMGDVAEIFGDDARVAAALAEIPLCPAPAAGSTRVLAQNDVRELLALSGVDRNVAKVTGSEAVTITADGNGQLSTLPKRPMVAVGVRQAVFEAEEYADRKQAHARSQLSLTGVSADPKEVTAEPIVARGSTVTVQARAAGVRITTSGKALDAGAAGDTVTVELADNKQRVLARVTGSQTVEVGAGSSTAAMTR